MARRIPILDLDGTLVDTDDALVAPFVALGVPRDQVTFGHVLADECARLGVDVDAYLDAYDPSLVRPFPGVDAVVRSLDRWAVCSNKHAQHGRAELVRFGWTPDVAMFSEDFGGPKELQPMLDAMGLTRDQVVFVGDTEHDRHVAAAVDVPFGLAGWNPRATAADGDVLLEEPAAIVAFCEGALSPR